MYVTIPLYSTDVYLWIMAKYQKHEHIREYHKVTTEHISAEYSTVYEFDTLAGVRAYLKDKKNDYKGWMELADQLGCKWYDIGDYPDAWMQIEYKDGSIVTWTESNDEHAAEKIQKIKVNGIVKFWFECNEFDDTSIYGLNPREYVDYAGEYYIGHDWFKDL